MVEINAQTSTLVRTAVQNENKVNFTAEEGSRTGVTDQIIAELEPLLKGKVGFRYVTKR